MALANKPALPLLVVLAAGCSYSAFNDLQDRAPAVRVDQDSSDVSSSSFGDGLVGLPRPGSEPGGLVAITGNADPAFTISTLSGSGKASTSHADSDDINDELDRPDRIESMAPAPSGSAVGTAQGPFVYIGTSAGVTGSVRVFDAGTFRQVPPAYPAPATVNGFGLALAPARLDPTTDEDDLAVGATDSVVLLRAVDGAWPSMQTDKARVIAGGADWPGGGFSVLAAGDLDPSTGEDEVAAAVPEKNAVVVVHHIDGCFQDPSLPCPFLRIPAPDGTSGFGQALLVADVDDDGAAELVVGAPDANRVYVYDLVAGNFDTSAPVAPPEPATLTAQGSRSFGASLAFGSFDGVNPMLAVGAPGSEVAGKSSAGRLHLFGTDLQQIGEGVELARPDDKTMLGRRLARVPLHMADATEPLDLLAASGRDAVFLFFSNLTASHEDVRDN